MPRRSDQSFNPTHSLYGSEGGGKPFRPAHGRDFFGDAEIIRAETAQHTEKSRNHLAFVVVSLIVVSVGAAAALSVSKSDYSYVSVVWGVVGPIAGAIIGHYFRHDRKEDR